MVSTDEPERDATVMADDLFVVDEHSTRSPPRSEMYYRDLYKERLDFRAIAREDPRLCQITLLRRDFGLSLELPPDRLCPPVPNRHAYVLWLKALLDCTTTPDGTSSATETPITGADIGTGASCIYPLLACTQRPGWRFIATDIDAASLAHARSNVARNGLAERIRVVARTAEDPLVPLGDHAHAGSPLPERLDFVMVNPPFYASADEMAASAADKERPPHSACTGAPVEMIYEGRCDGGPLSIGGEVAFVGRLMDESAVLRRRVTWYTAMLGKLSSLVALVERLRAQGVDNYAVAAFVTSRKTRRWALGWSYGARRPTVDVARGYLSASSSSAGGNGFDTCRHILPPITEVDVWSLPPSRGDGATGSVASLGKTIDTAMEALELVSWTWDARTLRGTGRARENVWGRAWRRKKMRQSTDEPRDAAMDDSAIAFLIAVHVGITETTVSCRWLEGHNETLYQSFCGFLKAKLKDNPSASGDG